MRTLALLLAAGCGFHGNASSDASVDPSNEAGHHDAPPIDDLPPPDASFTYSKTIDIHPTGATDDLTGFPFLVHEASDPQLKAHARSDGADIVFLDETNAPIPHELEFFEGDGGIIAWVRVPTLRAAAMTTIHMAYGSGVAAQPTATLVWGAEAEGVYHFDDTGATIADSTSHQRHGTVVGNPMRGKAGIIHEAVKFEPGTCVDLGDHFDFPMTKPWTISLWTMSKTAMPPQTDYRRILARVDYTGGVNGFDFEQHGGNGFPQVSRSIGGNASFGLVATALSMSQFTLLTAVYDGASLILYGNGPYGTGTNDARTMPSIAKRFTVGCDDYSGQPSDTYEGTIDEVRIESIARSTAWIYVEHLQYRNPDTSYTIGTEQMN